MRVINVVMIKDGVVDNVESFGVFDESKVQEVVKEAEEKFIEQATYLGFGSNREDVTEGQILEDGYFEPQYGIYASVCITWSEI
jgi:hypothetical protein